MIIDATLSSIGTDHVCAPSQGLGASRCQWRCHIRQCCPFLHTQCHCRDAQSSIGRSLNCTPALPSESRLATLLLSPGAPFAPMPLLRLPAVPCFLIGNLEERVRLSFFSMVGPPFVGSVEACCTCCSGSGAGSGGCESCSGMLPFAGCCCGVDEGGSPPALLGTSRLYRTGLRSAVGLAEMGNRVDDGPVLLSLRWPLACGAGLGARDREAMALLRASMFSRRCDSSVLIPRGRLSFAEALPPLGVCERALARFSSPKMASLWAKRSRIRR